MYCDIWSLYEWRNLLKYLKAGEDLAQEFPYPSHFLTFHLHFLLLPKAVLFPLSLFLFEIYTAPPFYPYPSDLCNKSPLPFSRGDFIPHSPLNTSWRLYRIPGTCIKALDYLSIYCSVCVYIHTYRAFPSPFPFYYSPICDKGQLLDFPLKWDCIGLPQTCFSCLRPYLPSHFYKK